MVYLRSPLSHCQLRGWGVPARLSFRRDLKGERHDTSPLTQTPGRSSTTRRPGDLSEGQNRCSQTFVCPHFGRNTNKHTQRRHGKGTAYTLQDHTPCDFYVSPKVRGWNRGLRGPPMAAVAHSLPPACLGSPSLLCCCFWHASGPLPPVLSASEVSLAGCKRILSPLTGNDKSVGRPAPPKPSLIREGFHCMYLSIYGTGKRALCLKACRSGFESLL